MGMLKDMKSLSDKTKSELQAFKRDNHIHYQEFLAAAVNHEKLMTDENIKVAFDMFDKEGKGTINAHDFYHLMSNCASEGVKGGCNDDHA